MLLNKMSAAQKQAMRSRGAEIACLLNDIFCNLPSGYEFLLDAALRLNTEYNSGHESHLYCDMGYLILQLARPAIANERSDRTAEIADRLDTMFAQIEAGIVSSEASDEDDIPY